MVTKGFHSGGASYVLSRESLRRFYEAHQDQHTTCRKDGGMEDIEIAKCLRTRDVYPGKSLDKYNREMFHPLRFINHFRRKVGWLEAYAENPLQIVCLSKDSRFVYTYSLFRIMIVVVINPYHSIM